MATVIIFLWIKKKINKKFFKLDKWLDGFWLGEALDTDWSPILLNLVEGESVKILDYAAGGWTSELEDVLDELVNYIQKTFLIILLKNKILQDILRLDEIKTKK